MRRLLSIFVMLGLVWSAVSFACEGQATFGSHAICCRDAGATDDCEEARHPCKSVGHLIDGGGDCFTVADFVAAAPVKSDLFAATELPPVISQEMSFDLPPSRASYQAPEPVTLSSSSHTPIYLLTRRIRR